eukprot:CAMPEP_0176039092 /NCGR_PEP_ID=MMETSP0120_2-20121206/19377_1 /TAXON_ID=160619 /ORGANISM="Kryptoperidinium foliaceum, Strain CCMP 1326" /LENGTH=338 /DNA_ID=CAMNT_0017372487 /DNA_START=89 /DNA_END=1105 /DNA_ORIENTATION=-
MSAPYENMEPETCCQKCVRQAKKCVLGTCCLVILAVCLVQGVLYWWATMKCNARSLKNYTYPDVSSEDLVPRNSLLVEREPAWWGDSFINIPADSAGLPLGASDGVIFMTWGPIFNTYVYQDIGGHETFVIRDRPLALGGSHKIMRCDGEGPSYVFSEGSHWIMNNIRELFGMYTTRSFNIWRGSEKVAISEKVGGSGSSHKQIVFRAPDADVPFASCFLKSQHYNGKFDEWFVQQEKNMTDLPAFVPHSCCALMAFRTAAEKKPDSEASKASEPKEFLEMTGQAVDLSAVAPNDVAPEALVDAVAERVGAAGESVEAAADEEAAVPAPAAEEERRFV